MLNDEGCRPIRSIFLSLFIVPNVAVALRPANAYDASSAKTIIARLKAEGVIRPIEFVRIKKGRFIMGCNPEEDQTLCVDNEMPHRVEISRDFELQRTPVTKGQWLEVMEPTEVTNDFDNQRKYCPGNYINELGICPNHPLYWLTWTDAQRYIETLNRAQGLDCSTFKKARSTTGCYRLPTEAEWEYAARAGTKTSFFCGNDVACLKNYSSNKSWPIDVGAKLPNPWGLFDMVGVEKQWVNDYYENNYGLSQSQLQNGVVDPLVFRFFVSRTFET